MTWLKCMTQKTKYKSNDKCIAIEWIKVSKTDERRWEKEKKKFTEDDECVCEKSECVFTYILMDAPPIINKLSIGITMPGIKCINYIWQIMEKKSSFFFSCYGPY